MIEWKKEYEFGIKEIDDQHRHFIETCNELMVAVNAGSEREQIGLIMDKIISYATIHFQTEEGYFRKFEFAGATEHSNQHLLMGEQLYDYVKRHAAGENVALALFGFATDWLFTHIRIYDQAYVDDFRRRGLI